MAIQFQIRRGNNSENKLFVGAVGELSYDTQNKEVRVHDGSTAGGKILCVPVGTIIACAAHSIPEGWLSCDGSAISRTAYAALFSVIGTSYGSGDGSTTFRVPDCRHKLPTHGFLSQESIGDVIHGELPNITAKKLATSFGSGFGEGGDATGAFYTVESNGNDADGGWRRISRGLGFDASRVSSVYKNSATDVVPAGVIMRYLIKY